MKEERTNLNFYVFTLQSRENFWRNFFWECLRTKWIRICPWIWKDVGRRFNSISRRNNRWEDYIPPHPPTFIWHIHICIQHKHYYFYVFRVCFLSFSVCLCPCGFTFNPPENLVQLSQFVLYKSIYSLLLVIIVLPFSCFFFFIFLTPPHRAPSKRRMLRGNCARVRSRTTNGMKSRRKRRWKRIPIGILLIPLPFIKYFKFKSKL